jgi:hypothetical protein
MIFKPAVSASLAVASIVAVATAADKPDERLLKVTTMFVSGNNPAAEKIRSLLREGKKTCFVLTTKATDSDAVLEVVDNSQMQPGSMVGERQSLVSGNLTLKSGDLIWSGSERFSDAPFMSGSKTAGELLIRKLARDARCQQRSKKK